MQIYNNILEQIGYIFEFLGNDKKLTLFAVNFLQAMQYVNAHPMLNNLEILNVHCFKPISFVTEKNVLNGSFIWVGKNNSPDGWKPKNNY